MLATTKKIPVRISIPYMRGTSVFKEIIAFSVHIDGTRFKAVPETSTVLCRQLGIDESIFFEFIDHTIVVDRKTTEDVFELIKDIVQELITLDIIN
jgi:hypothetical protein